MDRRRHLQRFERHAGKCRDQRAIGERAALRGQRRRHQEPLAVVIGDANGQPVSAVDDAKSIFDLHAHERRDMELLHTALPLDLCVGIINADQVRMTLAKRVRHFPDDRRRPIARVVTKVHAERVEHVAQHPRHRQQANRSVGCEASRSSQRGDFIAQGAVAAVRVVARVKADEVEALDRQELHGARRLAEGIEIEKQPKDAIFEPMPTRPLTPMHHRADIKPGVDHGAVISSAAASRRTPPK
ncbi:MAG TPA: hypothetical protein VKA12_13570 [Roseiarcus sp.]|nr:hypothetical protein [Roseiarcus sp.]